MKEIILTKTSVYRDVLSHRHFFRNFEAFMKLNKPSFTEESWDCYAQTSLNVTRNILELSEFRYIKEHLTILFKKFYKEQPFMISDSWINIYNQHGFQEFHCHPAHPWAGVMYLTNDNSEIEFINFYPKEIKMKIKPKKFDIFIFEGSTYHRVLPQKNTTERLSLTFNTVKI
tara:strand:- start:5864 stop:6379 length:516 start_codon:yes stop_codon:yes gene_type:complete